MVVFLYWFSCFLAPGVNFIILGCLGVAYEYSIAMGMTVMVLIIMFMIVMAIMTVLAELRMTVMDVYDGILKLLCSIQQPWRSSGGAFLFCRLGAFVHDRLFLTILVMGRPEVAIKKTSISAWLVVEHSSASTVNYSSHQPKIVKWYSTGHLIINRKAVPGWNGYVLH